MGQDAMILGFWMLNFKPAFLLSSLTFIKRLFSSSSLSAIKVISSAHLRLLIFLSAIFIPACASSSSAFHMLFSVWKLNMQGDNRQPWHTPFPIWNQSVVPCPVLTAASWPTYRFLWKQVRWSGTPISLRIFQFVVIHHGLNIPGSYAILFFTAFNFTFTTRHIHNWMSFLLWPNCFILSGATSNCPLLFPSSRLDTFWLRGLSSIVISFCFFIVFRGLS